MKRNCGKYFSTLLWLLVVPCLIFAQNHHRTKPEVRVSTQPQELIRITPSTENIRLTPNPQSDNTLGPWSSSGAFSVDVQSAIPTLGVAVEAGRLHGPQGDIPPDRIWVSSEGTGNQFRSLTTPVPVFEGIHRGPVRQTELELEVRPQWDDPPGEYDGELLLKPMSPGMDSTISPAPYKDRSRAARPYFAPAPDQYSGVVCFSLEIEEMIDIGTSGGGLHFPGVEGPGTYYAEPLLRVVFCTNAYHWWVECSATNLVSERGEIPAERILWEQLDDEGNVEASGNLGLNVIILEGYGSVQPSEITLRFSMEITTADVAGDYEGSLSVNAMTGS